MFFKKGLKEQLVTHFYLPGFILVKSPHNY